MEPSTAHASLPSDYAIIIPTECGNSVSIDASVLQSAVDRDRVSVVVLDKVKAIKLSFIEDKLVLSSASSDQGDASEGLSVDCEGSEYATKASEIIRETVIDAIQNSGA
ncbi:hypothetical protein P029_04385 [Anaplasma phagocytophilum str. Norway variant2]|uniref:DNA polymerase III beta sliding clamp C-terminal domain-containing protein n=1 Tax=Anaplasma phagocytophilum str. Norway variant2 TaxID=1392507 RepID=A0A161IRD7_ANAPH|nr:hypothetical protein [Anaplasma phagocytophilum]ANC34548.1 hypothetical protein P029_04385 [Anaplasma phagocytophilum str. Norway variant2]